MGHSGLVPRWLLMFQGMLKGLQSAHVQRMDASACASPRGGSSTRSASWAARSASHHHAGQILRVELSVLLGKVPSGLRTLVSEVTSAWLTFLNAAGTPSE